jgi:ribosomal protein L37AE/L43A
MEIFLIVVAVLGFVVGILISVSEQNTEKHNRSTQACPKCRSKTGFYRQPITIEKPAIGLGAAVTRATYQETKQVNFCKKCNVEILPRVIF